tara:strand:+ start:520 stop:738 length:219 start_codon:yes stop_codon:yes gene_type:complete
MGKCTIGQLVSFKLYIVEMIEDYEWADRYENWDAIIVCVRFMWDMLEWADIELEERMGMYAFLNSVDRYISA